MDDIQALCKRVLVIDKGKILYDGALEKLVEKYADDKILTVQFSGSVPRVELERFGLINEYTPEQVQMRIPRADVARVASEMLSTHQVADVNIEEVPIEEVIRIIFAGQSSSK
jgi:ABC-2 type transport system ATP-binding protein